MRWLLAGLMLLATPAYADRSIVLTDMEAQALLELIDAAVKAQGLNAAANAVFLANKIKTAPIVATPKEDEPRKPVGP